MAKLYAPSVYDRSSPIGSYWQSTVADLEVGCEPLNQVETCDIAIIGGGITGLSAALHLLREHDVDVRIIEAGTPAWGASGRNGGFCCIGSTKLSNPELLRRFGKAETQRFYREQQQGIDLVHQLAADEAIAIDAQGQGEIRVAHRPSRLTELEADAEFLTHVAGYPCALWSQQQLAAAGFQSPESYAALHVKVGFGLNPLKYALGLATAVQRRGGHLYGHSPLIAWETHESWHHLKTPAGLLKARRVIVATNGYSQDSLHPLLRDRLLPTLSNIIVTRPITPAERAAQGWHTETPMYDTRHLLFYYRLLKDGRCLFGSRGGTRGTSTESDRHCHWMHRRFVDLFPAWRDVEITHNWTGLVCISAALTPHVGQFADDPTVFYSLAYHGNGVAAGTWCGRLVARLAVQAEQPSQMCAVFTQPLRKFLLPSLRLWYLRSMYALYHVQDAWQ